MFESLRYPPRPRVLFGVALAPLVGLAPANPPDNPEWPGMNPPLEYQAGTVLAQSMIGQTDTRPQFATGGAVEAPLIRLDLRTVRRGSVS